MPGSRGSTPSYRCVAGLAPALLMLRSMKRVMQMAGRCVWVAVFLGPVPHARAQKSDSAGSGEALIGELSDDSALYSCGKLSFLGTSVPTFGVMFQAMAGNSRADILSTPHLLTADNEPAKISVGENIPVKSGQVSFTSAVGGDDLIVPQASRATARYSPRARAHAQWRDRAGCRA